ncbi:hypothetical protein Q7P37_009762 [Cladosporium fusiforme]
MRTARQTRAHTINFPFSHKERTVTPLTVRNTCLLDYANPKLTLVPPESIMLKGSVAITGGASGIGLALAQLAASKGAKVSFADVCERKIEKALPLIRAHANNKDDVMAHQCDVSKGGDVRTWLKATRERHGHLKHVANVAGVWREGSTSEIEDKDWDRIMDVNLKGSMHVLRESARLMENHSNCSIVMVSSVCGLMGFPGNAAYGASKYGVIGLTKCAAIDLGSRGIRVNCIAPGMVDTPLARSGPGLELAKAFSLQTPIRRIAEPSEIASMMAVFLGEESKFTTGCVCAVDGGASV